jgi:glycine cleavage system transcriptional repressor
MEKKFIMTAIGPDRPGFVADVTQLIYEHGCNLEDSTMTKLEDEFAMIFSFTSQQADVEEQLAKACRRLEREKRISAFLRSVPPHDLQTRRNVFTGMLTVEGVDHVGIVYRVSRYLADHQINIRDVQSKVSFSPGSGTCVFKVDMHLEIPAGTNMAILRDGLQQVGNELQVDISM